MLNCLDRVRTGLLRPTAFQSAEITRRTLNFSLSSVAVVEPVFSAAIFSIDIDSTGRYLLTGASDGTWYIHDTFNLKKTIDHEKKCVGQCTRGVAHQRSIRTVEWYPSDNGLFVSSSSEGRLCLWDANNSSKPVEQYNLEGNITRHQINPCCGTTIATCCDGEVNLIDLRAGTSIQKLPETSTNSMEVAWNPKNEFVLIVGSSEGHLIEWDVRSTLNYRGYGLLEVVSSRKGVRTRDFKEQVNLLQRAHEGGILSIKYAKDGMEFYTFGEDAQIRRWLSETNPLHEPLVSTLKYGRKSKGHGNLQIGLSSETDPPLIFAPKGISIAVCDMKTCRVEKELVGHFKNVNCFVYDELYQQGYSGGNDSAVMIWSGNQITEQTYQQEKIDSTFSSTSSRRRRQQRVNPQLVNLIDNEEDFEEYEVASEEEEFGS